MAVLRDPSIGLDCTETPFHPPKTLSRVDLAVCASCTLYVTANIVGPKNLQILDTGGLLLNESPLIQIENNGTTYGLSKTYLWPYGIHRDFKVDKNYDMELNLYFRDIYSPEKQLAVVIPITIDDAKGMPYFTEVDNNQRVIALDTIITKDAPALVYKGIDLQGRDGSKKQTSAQCLSTTSNLTWYIFSPTFIKQADAKRIRSINVPKTNTNPVPDHEITLARARQMCMIIPSVKLKKDVIASAAAATSKNDVFLTRALQCQRIDPSKDVKGDKVYLNGPATSTLSSELDDAANLNKSVDAGTKSSIRAKTIEDLLAIIIGVSVGLILISVVVYYIFKTMYKGYLPTVAAVDAALVKAVVPCKPAILF